MDEMTRMISQVQEILTAAQRDLETTLKNSETTLEKAAERIRADIANKQQEIQLEAKRIIEANKLSAEKTQQSRALVEKELNNLKESIDKELKAIDKKYRAKLGDEQNNMKKAFEKFGAFYTEAQAKVASIVEKNKSQPAIMMQTLMNESEAFQKKFLVMKDDITKACTSSADRIRKLNEELEKNMINTIQQNKTKYEEIIKKLKAIHK